MDEMLLGKVAVFGFPTHNGKFTLIFIIVMMYWMWINCVNFTSITAHVFLKHITV